MMRKALLFLLAGLSSGLAFKPLLGRRKVLNIGTAGTMGLVGGVAAANALGTFLLSDNPAASPTSIDAKTVYTPAPGSLEGQTIVVTGGTTGLGLESVKRLAVGGATVILTSRTEKKGQAALAQVQDYLQEKGIQNDRVSYKILDFDDLQTLKSVPANWEDVKQIDVLLNNAGVMALPELQRTVDGYEKQMQSNHLGHFALTALLAPKLANNARIINVSSAAHEIASDTGLLPTQDLWAPEPSKYGPWRAYGQSKLSNLLFTQELQRRSAAAGKDWSVTSLHPGAVTTDLGRNLFGGEQKYQDFKDGKSNFVQMTMMKTMAAFLKTVPQGATTQVWLAARADEQDPSVGSVRSKYFVDCKAKPLSKSYQTDALAAARLWKESEERAGVEFKL